MLNPTLHRRPLRASARPTLLLLVWTLLPALLAAQGAGTGVIEGRVFDAGRGEYLEKALISVEGTRLEVLSGETGQYRLANVPAGTVRVKAFFTGLPLQTVTATVTAGQTTTLDLTFAAAAGRRAGGDVVRLDQFVVASSKEMEGAAIAINEQRFARNIVNVVSADEFGTIADGSIGEFMKFLPGITRLQRLLADEGRRARLWPPHPRSGLGPDVLQDPPGCRRVRDRAGLEDLRLHRLRRLLPPIHAPIEHRDAVARGPGRHQRRRHRHHRPARHHAR